MQIALNFSQGRWKNPQRFQRTLAVITLLATSTWCLAEAGLKAYVVLNTEGGGPVAQVPFSADGQNQISLSDGSFAMRFVQRNPGDVVRLVMQRPGWDVVNRHVMTHTLLSHPDPARLEIIVAREAEREQRALAYYRLKGNQVVEQQLQLKLAELSGRNAATAEELARLQRERDQARQQIDELARKYAQAKPGATSDVDNQAMKLFLDGQLDQALALLSEARLTEEAAKAQSKLKQNVDSWQLRAKLLAAKFEFAGALHAYQKTTELLPGDGDVWFQYAYFHQNQNQWEHARRGYERAVGLYRLNDEMANIALVQNNLGVLHRSQNRNTEARAAYMESLRIHRALALSNPDVYLPYVANNLNNLGILHRTENRNSEARAAYEESLEIRRTLALKNPDVYLPFVANSLNNLGVLNRAENRNTKVRAAYEESLEIRRTLALKNPDGYLPDVASSLNNLGVLHSEENRKAEALAAHEESLGIYRTLAIKNPDVYLPFMAGSLNNLGILHRSENRNTEARAAYEESLKIRRALALKNPDVYLPDVANSLTNLGILHLAENGTAKARTAFSEAFEIYQQFVQRSESYRESLNAMQRVLDDLEK